ncbi:oligoendopeptidase F [Sporomusa sphaeroides]|uniref:Oligopeptidase F n=1 Tax=Sporomusa sphaeroides DSM 2875 TaxID=1337886 RepID=A0ABP2C367_9FIRM|nr:oligoendopeptidase F [Sporomusa sphaeroides]OLS55966.1 oligoendopeptidase F, plasmid [Sporomusa sphaeroides DSM 2875]CVK18966.1 Oligoendopeptidase F, plasmid [Sporomusa sphaeroides DSM 2875]
MPQTSTSLPSREQIQAEYKWQVENIYANEQLWQADFDKVKNALPGITEYKGTLSQTPAKLAACLKLRDEINILAGKLFAYARLHRDENSANAKYQALVGKTEGLLAETSAATAFIEPEILAISDDMLAAFRREQSLAEYSFYFDNLIRQKQHVLSPAEEEILSRSAEATQASENIFNMLAHADMKFPDITGEDGQKITLSEGRYRSLIMSADRRVRQEAFSGLFGSYNTFRNTFAATLAGNVKKNIFYSRTRKYNSTLESALSESNIPVNVYDNLLATVNNNLAPLHRYIALKKKALQLDEIHMYDLYTPLAQAVKFNIPYAEGLKLVREGLAPLGTEYADILNKGLTSGWIDVYENKGKQTGAYCWGVYGVHPFVLLNYNDRLEDVSTLAHEMGHAIHSYYSQAAQPYATSQYTIFTAEVASTTNEILLNDFLLKATTDKQKKLYLINQYLEMVRATVYRQTMFAEFEKSIYDKAEEGETLTADLLDALWHTLNTKYYGPGMVVDSEIDVEWARIPHFYWNFYVYQYVTGYAAATTLAEKMANGGTGDKQRYIEFLKSGGSDYPLSILKQAGVDMSTPQPVELTLNKFSTMLDELEKLISKS